MKRVGCWGQRDTRGKRGYDGAFGAGVTELLAQVGRSFLRGWGGAMGAGVTDLFVWVGRRWGAGTAEGAWGR